MGRTAQDVTDAELAVLKVLWEQSPATIREITETIYPRGSESDYATVKKLLARLETKACVQKHRRSIPHQFTAVISLDDLVGRRLQKLANHLCDGSPVPLLMHLLQGEGISDEQQQELRKLVEQFSTSPPPEERQS
ncbi:MAG: BlaI/MecI/CopY family transcriptional regulator [Planctomycetota bacterium]